MIVLLKTEIGAFQLESTIVILRAESCVKVPEHLYSRFAFRLFDFSILRLWSVNETG